MVLCIVRISLSLSNGATAQGGPRPPLGVSSIHPGLGRLLSNFYILASLHLPPLHLPNAVWVSLWGVFLLAHWKELWYFFILLLISSSSISPFRYSFFLFLKCLLASYLTLFRLSTLLWFGSYTHCTLTCFLWSKNVNTLHQTMVYVASILADLDSL